MIAELAAGIDQLRALANRLQDLAFGCVDFFGDAENFVLMRSGDYEDAVGIAAQDIAGIDARIADVHGAVRGFHLHAVLAGAHGIAAAEDRVAEREGKMHVAAGAVDYGAGDAALVRDGGQDVAPDGGVLAAAVVEDDDGVRWEIVDVIAYRAGGRGRGAVEDREGAAGQTEAVVERLNAEALAGDAEAIKGVAE